MTEKLDVAVAKLAALPAHDQDRIAHGYCKNFQTKSSGTISSLKRRIFSAGLHLKLVSNAWPA